MKLELQHTKESAASERGDDIRISQVCEGLGALTFATSLYAAKFDVVITLMRGIIVGVFTQYPPTGPPQSTHLSYRVRLAPSQANQKKPSSICPTRT